MEMQKVSKKRLAFIGLGSNLGDRLNWFNQAIESLRRLPKTRLMYYSSIYVTEPVGEKDQPEFFNAVVAVHTALPPMELLQHLQAIEEKLQRKRDKHWGPRTIDLDILAIEDITIQEGATLQVPHPLINKRKFVLLPWAEIAPDFIVPGIGKTVDKLLQLCHDTSGINLFLPAEQWGQQIDREKK